MSNSMCLIFFFNGLAFFSMALVIAVETRRASRFAMTEGLKLLSAHALVASLGNWLQMFLLAEVHVPSPAVELPLEAAKLVLFVLSAVLLLQFAFQMVLASYPRGKWLQGGFLALCLGYLVALTATVLQDGIQGTSWLADTETWARYILYLPALALSSLAMIAQCRASARMGTPEVRLDCLGAAGAFGLKAIVSGLIAIPILGHPGSVSPSVVVPLQSVRTLTTVVILIFFVRLLRIFEVERQRQLDKAVADRIDAQEKALEDQRRACGEIREWSASVADMVQAISSAISQPVGTGEMMRVVLEEAVRLSGLEGGTVFLRDPERPVVRLVAHQGLPPWITDHLSEVRVGAGLAGWVAEKGTLLIVDDLGKDERPFVPRTREAAKSFVGIPLVAAGKVLGVLGLFSLETLQLSAPQLALLTSAGQQLGVAIEGARLYEQVKGMAALEERARLARELHDNLVQVLGYLHLKSQMAQGYVTADQKARALEELRDVEQASAQAYDEVRDSISGLRLGLSADQDLGAALRQYTELFAEQSGIGVSLDIGAWQGVKLPMETEVQVLRIAQEALTNVRRHAQARQVRITCWTADGTATLSVCDDGRGFDPMLVRSDGRHHLGLQTMRERASSVGGELRVHSAPGQGTEIEVTVPRGR